MRICIDCGQEIKYGEGGWGGSNLHAKCRGKRGADSAKRQAEAAGRTFGSTRAKGSKNGERRAW